MHQISSIEAKGSKKEKIAEIVRQLEQERRNLLKQYTDTAYENTNSLKTAIEEINEGALKEKIKSV